MRIFNKDGLICALVVLFLTGCPSVREEAEYTASRCDGAASPFASGSGTSSNPYIICSASQLKNISNDLTAHYRLGKSFSLQGSSFQPIGADDSTGFSGTLDGANYTISNWSYSNATDPYAIGLVRKLAAGGVIKNLTLSSLVISGNNMVAGVAGISSGSISSVTVKSSTLSGKSTVAGVVGEGLTGASISSVAVVSVSLSSSGNGTRMNPTSPSYGNNAVAGVAALWNSSSSISGASVSGANFNFESGFHQQFFTFTGGVVGYLQNGSITDSTFSGTVSGQYDVGGIAGNAEVPVIRSRSSGTIQGLTRVGGVIGFSNSSVSQCSMVGTVFGDSAGDGSVGGVVGVSSGSIAESFASGTVIGKTTVGGIVGLFAGTELRDSYSFSNLTANASPVGGAMGSVSGGNLSNLYFAADSINASSGVAEAMIGSVLSAPASQTALYYKTNAVSSTNGGISRTVPELNALRSISGFDSVLWRSPTAYSGRSILSPVLAWECDQSGVTCAP